MISVNLIGGPFDGKVINLPEDVVKFGYVFLMTGPNRQIQYTFKKYIYLDDDSVFYKGHAAGCRCQECWY